MSNDITIEYTDQLVVVTCWCGINHAVPQGLRNYQRRCHDNGKAVPEIYCPLGHSHVPSGRGAAQIERERRALVERTLANRDEDLRAERAAHAATKGQLTKSRKRAEAALCPVPGCRRTIVQMGRHLRTKHPDFHHPEVAR